MDNMYQIIFCSWVLKKVAWLYTETMCWAHFSILLLEQKIDSAQKPFESKALL